MKMKFFDATHPARDGREHIPQEEAIARLAYEYLRGDDYQPAICFLADYNKAPFPRANKSARVYSRQRAGMGQWITIEGSSAWFAAIEQWYEAAEAARLAELRAEAEAW